MTRTLHETIRRDFEGRILSGDLGPGDRLPTEAELMQVYACSRMTVNKALSALASAGLIQRRKRAGTFVARPRAHSMVLAVPDLAEDVRARGQEYRFVQLGRTRRRADPGNAAEGELAGTGELVEIEGLHLADEIPLALETRRVSVAAVPDFANADFTGDPPGTWLLHHVPWTDAETSISAVATDERESSLLAVPSGTAALVVERQTWRGRDRITWVRQLFLGHAYELVARFGPSSAADRA